MIPKSGTPREQRVRTTALCLALLTSIGIPSLMPNLPLLAKSFAVPLEASSYIIAAFALPGLLFTPITGILSDRFGRKPILIPCLFLYGAAGIGGSLAQTFEQLLVFRFLQGIGGSCFSLLYATIIADTWQGEERAKMMGYMAFSLGISTAVFPAVGGLLGEIHWRLPLALPFLALPVAWLALYTPLTVPQKHIPLFLYLGQMTRLLAQKQTARLLGLTFLVFLLLSGPLVTCFPLFAEQTFQASPLKIGLLTSCASLSTGAAAYVLQFLYRSLSSRAILVIGQFFYATAFLLFPVFSEYWSLLWPIICYGAGQGLTLPLVTTLLSGQAGAEERAGMMAVNSLLIRVAQTGAPLAFSALISTFGAAAALQSGLVITVFIVFVLSFGAFPSVTLSQSDIR